MRTETIVERFVRHLFVLAAGIWLVAAVILDLVVVYVAFGGIGVLLALTVAPLAFLVAPFYAAFALDYWWPLVVEYGGFLLVLPLGWWLGRDE